MSGKCGHEKCHCRVDAVDFCSEYCEDRSDIAEVDVIGEDACRCGHAACAGE